jgi:hypothetical protein
MCPRFLPVLAFFAALALAGTTVAADAPASSTATPRASAAHMKPAAAEEQALFAVLEQGRQQVADLVATARDLPDGPARRALELKVLEIKRQNRVEFLRVKAQFARTRGDFAAASDLDRRIELLLNPPKPSATPAVQEKAPPREGSRP